MIYKMTYKRYQNYILILDLFSFSNIYIQCYKFPLSTAFTVSHEF